MAVQSSGPFHENASRKDRTLRHTNERLMTTEKQKAAKVNDCRSKCLKHGESIPPEEKMAYRIDG
ncbi:hypothetical protein OUZ56_004318 [Daphnia magna]|uniref:Uncharacterized protein n=1 Tax=Daphnia magna TaxID=35525 RepID=A0ABQ9YPE2_9CRUS|nr:hypothetical protein OUZ56_004318 [Daphnia magna]